MSANKQPLNQDFNTLRRVHPQLIYDSAMYQQDSDGVRAEWRFVLKNTQGDDKVFSPTLSIKGKLSVLPQNLLQNLVFQIGIVEMLSYWKAACPPEIVIRAGWLDQTQVGWWRDLLIKGLGEFFYTNQIDFTDPSLVSWIVTGEKPASKPNSQPDLQLSDTKIILPIGGGKDSAVTVEILKQALKTNQIEVDLELWSLNPIEASQQTASVAGFTLHEVHRQLDPQLLELNRLGYLNGHTPFSALLAFVYALVAAVTGTKYVLVSNEVSANECNAVYKGHEVNHQYSKSWEFERKFRQYSRAYLLPEYEYVSFLRPLHELRIARQFAKYPHHFSTFRSCNRGQKQGVWCHECSKCLFSFVMLYPFLDESVLISKVFNHNLFELRELTETALKLVSPDEEKPFDCVGSYEESKVAFWLSIQKYQKSGRDLPEVLRSVQTEVLSNESDWPNRAEAVLSDWNTNHSLPSFLEEVLKKAVDG